MKKLLLIWIFSGSLDGLCQDTLMKAPDGIHYIKSAVPKPDTLRCTLFVYYDRGPAIVHTKPGFVVMQDYKDNIYLDDRKKVIKSPLEVLTYKLKGGKK